MDSNQQYILNQLRKTVEQHYPSIQDAFIRIDTDRSGCISVEEFAAVLRLNNVSVPKEDLVCLAQAFDANQDGRVSYEDFYRTLEFGPAPGVNISPRTPPAGGHRAAPPPDTRQPYGQQYATPPAPTPPKMGMQLNTTAVSEARAQELLSYFRKAVEQSFPSLHRAFIHIDSDRSGYISAQELITLLYDHNVYPTWKELRDLIELLDVNGDGVIDYTEFGRAMHGKVSSPARASPQPHATSSRSPVATHSPGLINVGADPLLVHKALRKHCTQQDNNLRGTFRHINTSRTGAVSMPELADFAKLVIRSVTPEAIDELFDRYDLNHDGLIQFNEFVKAMSYDSW